MSATHAAAPWCHQPPDLDHVECPHLCEELHLIPRLRAGADHAHGADRFAREVFRGDCARGCGAEISNVAVVEENRGECAGPGIEYDDDTAVRG